MAQPASNEQHDTFQFKQTFNRISAMEQKFNSLKSLYVQNLQSLADKIEKKLVTPPVDQKETNITINTQIQPQTEEHLDNTQTLNRKIKKLAKLIRKSKHFVAFTGSAISPKHDHELEELRPEPVNNAGAKWNLSSIVKNERETEKVNPYKYIMPTASHMALTGLMSHEPQYLKYVISENSDNYHLQSGIDIDRLSEINTKHYNQKIATELALEETEKSDLFLVLGSSLSASSAAHMADIIGIKWNDEINNEMDREPTHHLVIINTTKTQLDHACGLRIFAPIEDVMTQLMSELKMEIPHWSLSRYLKVKVDGLEHRNVRKITICGIDIDGSNIDLFKNVELRYNAQNIRRAGAADRRLSLENLFGKRGLNIKRKPNMFMFHVPSIAISDNEMKYDDADDDMRLVIEVLFVEQYTEPRFVIEIDEYLAHLSNKNGSVVLKMSFDPIDNEWNVGNKREQLSDENVRKLWVNYDDDEEKNKPLPNPYELHDNH